MGPNNFSEDKITKKLSSSIEYQDSEGVYTVSTIFTIYMNEHSGTEPKTLKIDCLVKPDNWGRRILTVKLKNWEGFFGIKSFLENYTEEKNLERKKEFPVETGELTVNAVPEKKDLQINDFEKFVIEEADNGFWFGGKSKEPHIYFFEQSINGEPKDFQNIKELNSLFSRVVNLIEENPELNIIKNKEWHDRLREKNVLSQLRDNNPHTAVREALLVLEEQVRSIGDFSSNLTGQKLITEAFHKDKGKYQIGETGGEKEGFYFLFRGMMQALRNPASHRNLKEMSKSKAVEIIYFANFLLTKTEEI